MVKWPTENGDSSVGLIKLADLPCPELEDIADVCGIGIVSDNEYLHIGCV